jgi:hypothetical protein
MFFFFLLIINTKKHLLIHVFRITAGCVLKRWKVDGQTYCKRFIQYASNAVKLLSDTPDYKPIDITENSSFKIFGKVVAHTAP